MKSINKRAEKQKSRLPGLSLFANIGIVETYPYEVEVDIVVANERLLNRGKTDV